MKPLLNILLKLTWYSNLGTSVKYRLKKTGYSFKKTGWVVKLYKTKKDSNFFNKKWNFLTKAGWFSWKENETYFEGIADPFLFLNNNKVYLFFEIETDQGKGSIWCSTIESNKISKPVRVLKENFHLSYPNVFSYDNKIYLLPESYQDNSVRLYECNSFPDKWTFDKKIKEGLPLVDTNVIFYENTFYWFTYDLDIKKSRLYYSEKLKSEWIEHKESPFDSNRNAGRVIQMNGELFRPIQVENNSYGEGVSIKRILKLSKEEFQEEIYKENFLFKNEGYELDGIHHIDILNTEQGDDLVVTDGINNNYYALG